MNRALNINRCLVLLALGCIVVALSYAISEPRALLAAIPVIGLTCFLMRIDADNKNHKSQDAKDN